MLGNYEKKLFKDERVWVAKYHNLNNALHWHDEVELIYIDLGNAMIRIDDDEFLAKEGDVYVVEGEKLHYIHTDSESIITVFQFDGALTIPFDTVSLKSPKIKEKIDVRGYYEKISRALSRKEKFDAVYADSMSVAMLAEAYLSPTVKKMDSHKHKEKFKDILTYIEERLTTVSFEEICSHFYYSEAHFSRMFKKITSQTFTEYLTRLRIEKAVELLKSSSLNVTQIAESCGFYSIRHFNRCFKKLTGYTPKELPKDYSFSRDVYGYMRFDPTSKESELIIDK